MGDVLWKMSAAGEMRPLWRCPGCGVWCVTKGELKGCVSWPALDRDLALITGELQVTPAIDGLDGRRRRIF